MSTLVFSNIPSRVKAAVIDSIVLMVMIYLVSTILASFETVPTFVRVLLFIIVFGLYEPLLVSFFGATIGHSFAKIEVKQEAHPTKTLNFFQALLRFIIKYCLGWLSLLTMSSNEKRMAIHDHAVKSIVIDVS